MPKKRKTLPKDFGELIKSEDIETLKAIFNKCEIDAYSGGKYDKKSALCFSYCPDELSEWLVENGADLHYVDYYGHTPLHHRAGNLARESSMDILIKLGADLNFPDSDGFTPLHHTAGYHRVQQTEILLAAGSDINAKNSDGENPLECGLQRANSAYFPEMCEIAEMFFQYGLEVTPKMKAYVTLLGEGFEFMRDSPNEKHSKELTKLYSLYGVDPVPPRMMHDGESPIQVIGKRWDQKFDYLWDYLVPPSGPAVTMQGEVIRIVGRVTNEQRGNGGINWDKNYRQMCKAFLRYVSSHNALKKHDMFTLNSLISNTSLFMLSRNANQLPRLAVKWVSKNTIPIKLEEPNYDL